MQALSRVMLALGLIAALGPGTAAASPSEELDKARTEFRAGNYAVAIPMLSVLLYPTSTLTGAEELAEAHLLLGVSYFETGRRDAAATEIEEALALEPNLTISTSISKGAAEFFEGKKKEVEKREKEEAVARERARLRSRLKQAPAFERRQYWLNFAPFGLGQLQNGQRGKAIAFFASQTAMLATAFGVWLYLDRTYPEGTVPIDELESARRLQVIGYGADIVLVLLYGLGVIDSLANYEATVRRQLTEDEIEQLLKEEPEPSAFRLSPMITPEGAGAALTWEF